VASESLREEMAAGKCGGGVMKAQLSQ